MTMRHIGIMNADFMRLRARVFPNVPQGVIT